MHYVKCKYNYFLSWVRQNSFRQTHKERLSFTGNFLCPTSIDMCMVLFFHYSNETNVALWIFELGNKMSLNISQSYLNSPNYIFK